MIAINFIIKNRKHIVWFQERIERVYNFSLFAFAIKAVIQRLTQLRGSSADRRYDMINLVFCQIVIAIAKHLTNLFSVLIKYSSFNCFLQIGDRAIHLKTIKFIRKYRNNGGCSKHNSPLNVIENYLLFIREVESDVKYYLLNVI